MTPLDKPKRIPFRDQFTDVQDAAIREIVREEIAKADADNATRFERAMREFKSKPKAGE